MKTIVICVSSLDGKIARGPKDSIDWTSKEDRKFFSEETKKAGVIVIGSNTFENIGRALPGRLNVVYTSDPKKKKSEPGVLEFTKENPKKLLKSLEKRKFRKVFIAGGATVNALFLKNKLVDEIWLTIEGIIFGKGISLFGDGDFNFEAKLVSSQKLGRNGILLKYKLIY